jgi:transposase
MIIHPGFVGIDISKDFLDVFDSSVGAVRRIDNRPEAIDRLIAGWSRCEVFVLFEATGRYDKALRQALSAAGIAFARVNPARARDFARSAGFLAKTDAIDARMLAAMAQCLRPGADGAADPARELDDLFPDAPSLVCVVKKGSSWSRANGRKPRAVIHRSAARRLSLVFSLG